MKALIIFDLDGTLAESKQPLQEETGRLLTALLREARVAVISGASFRQFTEQFLPSLGTAPLNGWERLFLLPTNGASLYVWREERWRAEYEALLTAAEIELIRGAFAAALQDWGEPPPEQLYGEPLEARGGQVTFSWFGQSAPLALKQGWDPDHRKRDRLRELVIKRLPEFEVRIAGATSIDVTRPGIDKAYGIKKLAEFLNLELDQICFVGDAVFPGGNDYAAKTLGVETVAVAGPDETKNLIRNWLGL